MFKLKNCLLLVVLLLNSSSFLVAAGNGKKVNKFPFRYSAAIQEAKRLEQLEEIKQLGAAELGARFWLQEQERAGRDYLAHAFCKIHSTVQSFKEAESLIKALSEIKVNKNLADINKTAITVLCIYIKCAGDLTRRLRANSNYEISLNALLIDTRNDLISFSNLPLYAKIVCYLDRAVGYKFVAGCCNCKDCSINI